MIIKIGEREIEPSYSFNSFKYMGDFDVSELTEIEKKPFKLLSILEIMLMGAVNNDPRVRISVEEVQSYIEENIAEEGFITELLGFLMGKLEDSSFFKALQKPKKKKK